MKGLIPLMSGLAVLTCLMTACTDPAGAKRALEAQGMVGVELTGYDFFACGKGDEMHTGFNAYTASGMKVSGAVCRGWLSGSQVRVD